MRYAVLDVGAPWWNDEGYIQEIASALANARQIGWQEARERDSVHYGEGQHAVAQHERNAAAIIIARFANHISGTASINISHYNLNIYPKRVIRWSNEIFPFSRDMLIALRAFEDDPSTRDFCTNCYAQIMKRKRVTEPLCGLCRGTTAVEEGLTTGEAEVGSPDPDSGDDDFDDGSSDYDDSDDSDDSDAA